MAGVKNVERDGLVLAMELARRNESLRPLERDDPAATELGFVKRRYRYGLTRTDPYSIYQRR